MPYFYVIYFGILLVHRDMRDGEACEAGACTRQLFILSRFVLEIHSNDPIIPPDTS